MMEGCRLDTSVECAVQRFWTTREAQIKLQKRRKVRDQGTRGAVTGGKQLDGFLDLLIDITVRAGIPSNCIYTKRNELPGFFRPTKEWDFIVISPKKTLVACFELKSQVGSFGNNFNNRTEEALGSAVDLLTAYREGVFSDGLAPWIGYLMIVERSTQSISKVGVSEPHFKVMPEFESTSYLDRYKIFCTKLMRERLYTACAVIWTEKRPHKKPLFGYLDQSLSFENFIEAYTAYLRGRLHEFRP